MGMSKLRVDEMVGNFPECPSLVAPPVREATGAPWHSHSVAGHLSRVNMTTLDFCRVPAPGPDADEVRSDVSLVKQ